MSSPPGVPPGSVGTVPHDAVVPRVEVERALRAVHVAVEDLRDDLLQLAAQVVALTDAVSRRLPVATAPADAPGEAPAATLDDDVAAELPGTLASIRAAAVGASHHVELGGFDDKYQVVGSSPPCEELWPICKARCCALVFALSTQDLDEGVIRWDYGRPYLIKHRESDGRCVHNHPESGACTVYHHRPKPCRTYDCKDDARIWIDYERRIPVPDGKIRHGPPPDTGDFDLMARVQTRQRSLGMEALAVRGAYGRDDHGGNEGPE